jgi:hypothetical protein
MEEKERERWNRYAREGYVFSSVMREHRYTKGIYLILDERISKLEKTVATQQKIATACCAISIFSAVIHLIVQFRKFLKR